MNSAFFYTIIYLLGTVFCFYLWKKSKDRDYFWLALLGLTSIVFNSVRYIFLNILGIPFALEGYLYIISILFSIIVIGLVLKILFKKH